MDILKTQVGCLTSQGLQSTRAPEKMVETGCCCRTPGAREGCDPRRGRETKGDKSEAPPSCCRPALSHTCVGASATCPRPALSHTWEGASATCPRAAVGPNAARCSQPGVCEGRWRGIVSVTRPKLLLVWPGSGPSV